MHAATHPRTPRTRYRGRGFSLVELIVVLLVLGLLAGIAIVGYSVMTTRAQQTAAQANLIQADTAALAAATAAGTPVTRDQFTAAVAATGVTVVDGVAAAGTVYIGHAGDIPSRPGDFAVAFDNNDGIVNDTAGTRAIVLTRSGDGTVYTQTIAGPVLSHVQVAAPTATPTQLLQVGHVPPAISYATTKFTTGSQKLTPTTSGLLGTVTYSLSGTLPIGVTFDPATGTLTGPANLPTTATSAPTAPGSTTGYAVTSDGIVHSWGYGQFSQIGDGTSTVAHTAVATVAGSLAGKKVTALAGGTSHVLALASDGTVHGWGINNYGQFGDGTATSHPSPVQLSVLPAGKTVTAVTAGNQFSVLLMSDGTVYTAGRNDVGQLGNGTTTAQTTWGQVGGLLAGKTVTAIAAGDVFTVVRCSDGTLYSWGANAGQLGDGTTTQRTSPVKVLAPAGVTYAAIAAGSQHVVALGSDGALYTWGVDASNQLGDGGTTNRASYAKISGGTGKTFTSVGAGGVTGWAKASDGTWYGWGANYNASLGNGSSTAAYPIATPAVIGKALPTGSVITGVTGGQNFNLFVTSTGAVYGAGTNTYGQLGDGTTTPRTTPVLVSGFPGQSTFPFTVTVTATSGGQSVATGQVTFTGP